MKLKPYKPKFLGWTKSYDEEVRSLRRLIELSPDDNKTLKRDYKELTGKWYRRKRRTYE